MGTDSIRTGFAKAVVTHCGDTEGRRIHDDLYAGVAVFQGTDVSGAIVTLDGISPRPPRLVQSIKSAVESATGITPDRTIVTASHVHSGIQFDPDRLGSSIEELSREAIRASVPANVAYTKANVGKRFSLNRRIVTDGVGALSIMSPRDSIVDLENHTEDVSAVVRDFVRYGMNIHHPSWFKNGAIPDDGPDSPSPQAVALLQKLPDELILDGPVDSDLDIIQFSTAEGKIIGSLVRFTCHPVLYHSSYGTDNAVSADFPGVLTRKISEATDAPSLFVQGCAGNIRPLAEIIDDMNDELQRVGTGLAHAAIEAMRDAQPEPLHRFDCMRRVEQFPVAEDYLHRSQEEFDTAFKKFESDRKNGFDPHRHRECLDEVLRLWTATTFPLDRDSVELPFSLFGFNNLAVVTFPGEIFVEHGFAVQQKNPERNILPVSLTDSEASCYVPTREAFNLGGYEVAASTLPPGSGERMMDILNEMVAEYYKDSTH